MDFSIKILEEQVIAYGKHIDCGSYGNGEYYKMADNTLVSIKRDKDNNVQSITFIT